MRETRLSGSEGGAGSIPVPTPILGRAHLEGRWHESEAHVCHYSACPGEERGDQAIPLDRPGTLRAPRDDKRLSLIQNSRREEMQPTGTGPVNCAGLAADMRCPSSLSGLEISESGVG